MDGELQELFNYAVSEGVNLFDTADSYVEFLPVYFSYVTQADGDNKHVSCCCNLTCLHRAIQVLHFQLPCIGWCRHGKIKWAQRAAAGKVHWGASGFTERQK